MDIRLKFHDFWPNFNKEENVWTWLLRQKNNVVIVEENPNLVITMAGSKPYPNVYTIYYSNEPFFPNVSANNYADHYLSNFFLDIPNHTRFPSYYMYVYEFIRAGLIPDLSFFTKTNREVPIKNNFCAFVTRSFGGKRGDFFNRLNEYKKVDTNCGPTSSFTLPFDNTSFSSSKPKIDFIRDYKFVISFENNWRGTYPCFPNANVVDGLLTDMGGLISEKLVEPFIGGSLPIYWGSEMVSKEFNSKTFLNYYDFENEDALIAKIIELDNNDDLYKSYFNQAIISEAQNDVLTLDYMVNLMEYIIKNIK